jgi:hypothetical protein
VNAYARVLSELKPKRILEWGPGENTLMGLRAGAHVYSIEQDPSYIPYISPTAPFQSAVHPVASPLYIDLHGRNDADLYFVDSRRRLDCIRAARLHGTTPDRVLCLHDAQRLRYHAALREWHYVRFLELGFCVASMTERALHLE